MCNSKIALNLKKFKIVGLFVMRTNRYAFLIPVLSFSMRHLNSGLPINKKCSSEMSKNCSFVVDVNNREV